MGNLDRRAFALALLGALAFRARAAIDRADHHAGTLPSDLPAASAVTHVGMYVAWIIENRLEGRIHREVSRDGLEAVRERRMTGRAFLIRYCSAKLWDEDLDERGLAFTYAYYLGADGGAEGQYFDDYRAAFRELPTMYHVEDTWQSYERIEPAITAAYERWRKR